MNLLYWRDDSPARFKPISLGHCVHFPVKSRVLCCCFVRFCLVFIWMFYVSENALKWSVCSDKMCNYNVANGAHPQTHSEKWETQTLVPVFLSMLRIVLIFIDSFVFVMVFTVRTEPQGIAHNEHLTSTWMIWSIWLCFTHCCNGLVDEVFVLILSLSLSVLIS